LYILALFSLHIYVLVLLFIFCVRSEMGIRDRSTTDAQGVFSSVIDMPAGQGTLTLTFTVSSSGANNWTPTTSISDLLVVVMKKSTAGISIS
ncbi:phage tail tip domain-containing protein, partial [Escherichia coli]|uniref:phage tail tip domain-containing protein n=1 Tax=Escherichia coli TaxID=562 RepID=UPI00207B3889